MLNEVYMGAYTRIIQTPQAVYVSFKSVGNRQKFNIVMDRFNLFFPLKTWIEKRRAWQLLPSELENVIQFSIGVFGDTGYVLEKEGTTFQKPGQHPHFRYNSDKGGGI